MGEGHQIHIGQQTNSSECDTRFVTLFKITTHGAGFDCNDLMHDAFCILNSFQRSAVGSVHCALSRITNHSLVSPFRSKPRNNVPRNVFQI